MKKVLPSKKILIFGIDSFTGTYLEKNFLLNGFTVYGSVNVNITTKHHFNCDIRNIKEIISLIDKIEPDYIINLAAISFVAEKNRSLFYDVNVIGAQNILEAIIKTCRNPKKIIFAGSAVVYGNQGIEILDETLCPKPVNHYGCSKLAMEHIVKTYFDRLNIIITRPFNYTGIGQAEHFLIPKIVKHYKEKKTSIELGNLNVYREFNDVRSIVDLYHQLLLSDFNSEIVNLCSNTTVKLMDIIEILNDLAGYQIEVFVNPEFIRENEITALSGSVKKLKKLIKLNIKYSINETIKWMYDSV